MPLLTILRWNYVENKIVGAVETEEGKTLVDIQMSFYRRYFFHQKEKSDKIKTNLKLWKKISLNIFNVLLVFFNVLSVYFILCVLFIEKNEIVCCVRILFIIV